MQAEGQDYVVLIYERPEPNYYRPVLSTSTRTGWVLEERPAGGFLLLQRQQTQMAVARAGIKSVGQHPMGEL